MASTGHDSSKGLIRGKQALCLEVVWGRLMQIVVLGICLAVGVTDLLAASGNPPQVGVGRIQIRAAIGQFLVLEGSAELADSTMWLKQGVPFANGARIVLTNVQVADSGDYVLTASNAFGASTSSWAKRVVVSPEVRQSWQTELDGWTGGPVDESVRNLRLAVATNALYVLGTFEYPSGANWKLTRYSTNGILLWSTNAPATELPQQSSELVANSAGEVFFTTALYSEKGIPVTRLHKVGADGHLLWSTLLGADATNTSDLPGRMVLATDGGVFVGIVTTIMGGRFDTLIKISSAGAVLWTRARPAIGSDVTVDVLTNGLGTVFVCGSAGTAAYANDGELLWTNWAMGGTPILSPHYPGRRLGIDSDGNVMAGSYRLTKLSQAGSAIWTNDVYADFFAVHPSGTIYVGGAVRMFNANGTPSWDAATELDAEDLAVDAAGNVFSIGNGYPSTHTTILAKCNSLGFRRWLVEQIPSDPWKTGRRDLFLPQLQALEDGAIFTAVVQDGEKLVITRYDQTPQPAGAPQFTVLPTNTLANPSEHPILTATAVGDGPLDYLWRAGYYYAGGGWLAHLLGHFGRHEPNHSTWTVRSALRWLLLR